VLVEARILRRAARAYCRNGGDVLKLARGMRISRDEARGFLDGRYHFVTPAATERLLALLDPRSAEYVAQTMRTHLTRSGKIPVSVAGPVCEEAILDAGGVAALCRISGFDQRRVYAIARQREGEVGLAVLDRLLTRSLGPLRWFEPDLRRWYFSGFTGTVLS
jgi:hypothetical protein